MQPLPSVALRATLPAATGGALLLVPRALDNHRHSHGHNFGHTL